MRRNTDQKNSEYGHNYFTEKKTRQRYVNKEETIWWEKLWPLEKKIDTNLFDLTDGSRLDNTLD